MEAGPALLRARSRLHIPRAVPPTYRIPPSFMSVKTIVRGALAASVLAFLAACGGGEAAAPPSPPPQVIPNGIAFTRDTATLAADDSLGTTVHVTMSDGSQGTTAGVTYTSSNPAVATVSASGL